jgi:hypothetical protein
VREKEEREKKEGEGEGGRKKRAWRKKRKGYGSECRY